MKVLIIGGGGREHALAEAFSRSAHATDVIVAPGNAGIATQYKCVPLESFAQITEFIHHEGVDLVMIGPEQPIAAGLSDHLRSQGIRVIAPSQAAARLESSKAFAKELMHKYHIPTARFVKVFDDQAAAAAMQDFGFPVVIKADGLASGKGVGVVNSLSEGIEFYHQLKSTGDSTLGGVVIEEYLRGWEVSLFAVCDGDSFQTMLFAQDHKQLEDYDQGPNTGGMGAYAPVPEAEKYRKPITEKIIGPVLKAMTDEGCPYEGFLYCGLMITADGPKVIEFNCRLGDPEAEVMLPRLKTDIIDICQAIVNRKVDELELEFEASTALGVVLAAEGYPTNPLKGISLPETSLIPTGVYFSGVDHLNGTLVSAGGRIMCVVGTGADLIQARQDAYAKVGSLAKPGMVYRHDIGLRQNKI